MNEGEKKCFLEDLQDNIIFKGYYKIEYYDENQKNYVKKPTHDGLHVTVYDQDGDIILSKAYTEEGFFSFTTHKFGEFKVCLSTVSIAWIETVKLKIYLDFETSESVDDYMDTLNRQDLDQSKAKIKSIIHIMRNILSQQNYQRIKEEKFRKTVAFTNSRLILWSSLQAFTLICVGLWQMNNLKTFFHSKKIV